MPEKKLIIASGGPLKGWLQQKLAEEEIENIVYEGMVSQDRLEWLVGNCIAGVYIPVDEDAGMTPVEFMSAGKPVIGVADGGLKETIVERKTGVLLNKEVDLEELQRGVREMTPQKAAEMREACEQRAEKFSSQAFFEQLDEVVYGE
jgi:glycosyltransferase involved in cell wall biosynthesis